MKIEKIKLWYCFVPVFAPILVMIATTIRLRRPDIYKGYSHLMKMQAKELLLGGCVPMALLSPGAALIGRWAYVNGSTTATVLSAVYFVLMLHIIAICIREVEYRTLNKEKNQ